MADRHHRKYTEVFKLEALALLRQGQKKASQIERELGITPSLLSRWQKHYQAVEQGPGELHPETSELEAAQAEIRRLQQKLAEVEEEREILKKAVNIFSRRDK